MSPVDRFKNIFEFKITFGNILTILTMIIAMTAAYANLETSVANIKDDVDSHKVYDDKRFAEFTTKETRLMRDKAVDEKFDMLMKRLDEANERLKRIEQLHMGSGVINVAPSK